MEASKRFVFEGRPSGDGDSFCFEVDKETFERFTGRTTTKYDLAYNFDAETEEELYKDDAYRLYPDDIFRQREKIRVEICARQCE